MRDTTLLTAAPPSRRPSTVTTSSPIRSPACAAGDAGEPHPDAGVATVDHLLELGVVGGAVVSGVAVTERAEHALDRGLLELRPVH
jgi:hypothetical protein